MQATIKEFYRDDMAKRNDKSRFELEELGFKPRREDEYIERLVLPSDTLQGIALLYNTTVKRQ